MGWVGVRARGVLQPLPLSLPASLALSRARALSLRLPLRARARVCVRGTGASETCLHFSFFFFQPTLLKELIKILKFLLYLLIIS